MPSNTPSPPNDTEFLAPTGALARAPISNAVRIGDQILLAGQIGLDADGNVVPGIAAQTRVCLDNIRAALEALDATMADVVQTRIYLTDFSGYADFNAVYREYFAEPFPVRATVGTPQLALGAEIEIEAVAFRRPTG